MSGQQNPRGVRHLARAAFCWPWRRPAWALICRTSRAFWQARH